MKMIFVPSGDQPGYRHAVDDAFQVAPPHAGEVVSWWSSLPSA
jgi:hypothetical protein